MTILRKISVNDNEAIAKIIREVLVELGVPKVGTAYADPELDTMFSTYQKARSTYFVIEVDGQLLGGGGIAPLAGGPEEICELQKMYFLPQARGMGWGEKLIDTCLGFAKEKGFTQCYLETMPYMKAAQKLYKKKAFDYIDGPMGATGHTSCNVWMTKTLA